jgi:hypothetical protein
MLNNNLRKAEHLLKKHLRQFYIQSEQYQYLRRGGDKGGPGLAPS